MVHVGSAILALLLNCYGVQIFFNPVHHPTSPFLSNVLFTCSAHFIIVQFDVYPASLRSIPWVTTRLYEYLVTQFLLEFCVCNIWFPLEASGILVLSTIADRIEWMSSYLTCLDPYTTSLCYYLKHYITGIILSYVISASCLTLVLHGTFVIDVNLIRQDGIFIFLQDCYQAAIEGCKLVIKKNPCRFHTVGVRQEMQRILRHTKKKKNIKRRGTI